ncbi:hypothetical protein [Streptomyces melanogenes]
MAGRTDPLDLLLHGEERAADGHGVLQVLPTAPASMCREATSLSASPG